MKVEFYRHNIDENDIERASIVLRSIFLTTGNEVHEFEEKLAQYLGCAQTVGVTSCTAALHLSLLACGIGPGDEVITTPMTFAATSNAILHTGATPVFVDVEPLTGNINVDLVLDAITSRTKAIIPVHLYGQICDMKRLRAIADKNGLILIEDAAHSLEAVRDGVRPGQLGDAACFSFYATKGITSGEGGAIATNNQELAERLRSLRQHGMTKGAADRYTKRYEHWDLLECGWKYNMDNIQAALLIGQLDRVDQYLQIKEQICQQYEAAFVKLSGVEYPRMYNNAISARHLFTIWVDSEKRDAVLWQLQDRGIGVAVNYRPVHLLSYYKNTYGYCRGMYPIAEKIGDSTISIPLYSKLKSEEIKYVIDSVTKVIHR